MDSANLKLKKKMVPHDRTAKVGPLKEDSQAGDSNAECDLWNITVPILH
jgi:hypothetical protein